MGDSEDEFDRQHRDKFQRERSEQFDRRAREREWGSRERPRGGWHGSPGNDMKPGGGMRIMAGGDIHRRRGGYPPPGHEMKRRFSPIRETEMRGRKRIRPFDPGFEGGWGAPWDHSGSRPPYHSRDDWGPGDRSAMGHPVNIEHGPHMMTFKQWLNMQSDDITDEDAVSKYTEYKIEFKRQQLQEFFLAHKDEEWFKEKYHPDEAAKRTMDEQTCVKWRAAVFKLLVENNVLDGVVLDLVNEPNIIKVLDSAVILMEGGKKFDLAVLDRDSSSLESYKENSVQQQPQNVKSKLQHENNNDTTEGVITPMLSDDQYEFKKQAELYKQLVDQTPKEDITEEKNLSEKCEKGDVRKNKRRDRGFMGYDDEVEGSSGDENQEDPKSIADSVIKSLPEHEMPQEKKEVVEAEKDCNEEGELSARNSSEENPRPLHQTHSIFMRNLPPTINKLEIVNLCKKFPGFIRVAFSHPLEDRSRFFRRCWVTFDRTVNIKDICWNLNNLRLRDLELNPVVNRDLARRVRPISGIAQHHSCARNDLKNIARLIMHLDEKWKIWEEKSMDENNTPVVGGNPYLKNISEYLVDESSAEEEDLLKGKAGKEEDSDVIQIYRDDDLIKVLDNLLYYLRIVHSVDYYNASEYPNEDEMPNRCGIIHARGPIPPNMLTQVDINEFQKRFNDKLVHILNFKDCLTIEETQKLGPKDINDEVEKFIKVNSQELGKDKWLCPLSGKKFKGPDYIRKHIFNKHADKVEGVKKDVVYFNNYLKDPRRPGPLDNVGVRPQNSPAQLVPPLTGYAPPPDRGFGLSGTPHFRGETAHHPYSSPQFQHRAPNPYGNGVTRTYPPKNREMRAGDSFSSRPIVGYQDLDAPDDTDLF